MKIKKLGEYFFGRNHNSWAIWCVDSVDATGGYSGQKICNCYTFEDALRKTYQLNGWELKNITRKY